MRISKSMIIATAIIGILPLTFAIGGHLYDLGHYLGKSTQIEYYTNGFWTNNKLQLEHIGWYMQYLAFTITYILLLNKNILRNDINDHRKKSI